MKPVTFRNMLFSCIALAGLAACQPATETAETPAAEPAPAAAPAIAPFTATADVHPFTIGGFQAAALRDGDLSAPNDNKTLAINKKKADVDAVLTANNLPTDMLHLSVQPLIVRTTDKVLLFDTGAAGLFGPTAGKLPATLQGAGIDPVTVTGIYITHGHGDHIGGLVNASGALAFPNANINIQAAEWAAIKGNPQMAALVAVITPKVVEFQPGADLGNGVQAVDIKGHTPGHSGYRISSDGQSLLYIGDTMHHHVISVQQPDWTIAFDGDAPVAQASRKQVIEESAASGQRVFAIHFPWPGIGKFEKKGDVYVWTPES